jgi:hypothetical protein
MTNAAKAIRCAIYTRVSTDSDSTMRLPRIFAAKRMRIGRLSERGTMTAGSQAAPPTGRRCSDCLPMSKHARLMLSLFTRSIVSRARSRTLPNWSSCSTLTASHSSL